MDYYSIITNLIKDPSVKTKLNPLVYYGLKLDYDKSFEERSPYFKKAVGRFFETLGDSLDISIFGESVIEQVPDQTTNRTQFNDTVCIDLNFSTMNLDKDKNLNISLNKDNYLNMSSVFKKDWAFTSKQIFDYDSEYILDRDDNFVLLRLIKSYLFNEEDPKTSQLLISYNMFASSIELIFCLKLVENFPKSLYNPREINKFEEYTDNIKMRINLFFNQWVRIYPHKYNKNNLIKSLIGPKISPIDDHSFLDLISLSMLEPLLNSKYVSFTKLIREGPFCFEIEEVARQMCIIDHEFISSIKLNDYNRYIIHKEAPESFNKFIFREKQLKCYILLFILMQNALENKKNMIQNFISLAHTCKLLNNYQTSYTIISAFNLAGLVKKTLLWRLIEKKYREVFNNLEKEFNDMELNETNIFIKNITFPMVPNIGSIKNCVNNFIIKLKNPDTTSRLGVCKEYKDFYLVTEELSKNKYSFFKVNPLYDFLKFGFLEIFKPRKWNLKLRTDFSHFTDDVNQLDQLLDFMVNSFDKLDN